MTTTPIDSDFDQITAGLVQPKLPRWAEILVGAMSVAIAGLFTMVLGWSLAGGAVVAGLLFVVGVPV